MPTTTRGYPYPTLAGANDPPRDIQLLAEAIEADVAALVVALAGTGGVHAALTDAQSCIAIPHGLGLVPTRVSAILGGKPLADVINPDQPRDYGVTIHDITATNLVVRLTNLRAEVWAGENVRAAIVWTARP